MQTTPTRRILLFGGAAVALALLLLVILAPRPIPAAGTVALRIAGRPQITNAVLVVSVVISNGTPRPLNIIDDRAGSPHFMLDAGDGDYPAGSGTHVVRLGPTGNTLKVNLAPGASLTNSVGVKSPPPRFRLMVETRDVALERKNWWVGPLARVLPRRWSEKLGKRLQAPMAISEWIEVKMPQQ